MEEVEGDGSGWNGGSGRSLLLAEAKRGMHGGWMNGWDGMGWDGIGAS